MAPFTSAEAARALQTLRATKLLTGWRGRTHLAFDALCEAAANMSRLAVDLRDQVLEMDVNPVLVSETAATAINVLIRNK